MNLSIDSMATAASSTPHHADIDGWLNYLHQRPKIVGWFSPPDPLLCATILYQQMNSGVAGDILEIGTYAGKSAVLLGFGLRSNETLHVCDPFVLPHLSNDPQLGVAHFLRNYRRFHSTDPDIFVGISRDFPCMGKSFRFTHIDGMHRYKEVTDDIQIARSHAVERSVVVMDDYANYGFPGVGAATWAAVERGQLTPFCMSPHKLYASVDPKAAPEWREALMAALANAQGLAITRQDFGGSEAMLVVPQSFSLRGLAREVMPPLALTWWRRWRWRH